MKIPCPQCTTKVPFFSCRCPNPVCRIEFTPRTVLGSILKHLTHETFAIKCPWCEHPVPFFGKTCKWCKLILSPQNVVRIWAARFLETTGLLKPRPISAERYSLFAFLLLVSFVTAAVYYGPTLSFGAILTGFLYCAVIGAILGSIFLWVLEAKLVAGIFLYSPRAARFGHACVVFAGFLGLWMLCATYQRPAAVVSAILLGLKICLWIFFGLLLPAIREFVDFLKSLIGKGGPPPPPPYQQQGRTVSED